MRKRIVGFVLAVTLISGMAHAGDSFTPGSHINNNRSFWAKAKAVWTAVFSR